MRRLEALAVEQLAFVFPMDRPAVEIEGNDIGSGDRLRRDGARPVQQLVERGAELRMARGQRPADCGRVLARGAEIARALLQLNLPARLAIARGTPEV